MPLHTLQATQLAWPTDWPALFGREAPLLLEIGFGSGHFLLDWAGRRSDANLLGVEVSLPSVRRAEQKLKTAVFDHVQLIQGSVETVLWTAVVPGSLAEVQINFSDPWPKHPERRVINGRFLHLLATRMVENGRLSIATDHADYATAITACLEQTPYFHSRLPTTFVTEDNDRLRTKYELKALAEGRTCHYYHWQRNQTSADNIFPHPQEQSMPHVVLQTSLTLDEMASHFTKRQATYADTTVRLVELFQSPHHPVLFIDTYIGEAPLNQRLGLTIRQRDHQKYVIGLHEVGFPRPTTGVHFAIHTAAQWLCQLDPAAQMISSNLRFQKEPVN